MALVNCDTKAILLCLFCLAKLITCPVDFLRGVSPERLSEYDVRKNFTCLDGSLSLPFSSVNDDYCDCPDGTDEPGTSACSNGLFYCPNDGYLPKEIPASYVDDGVCDCCDGSDENDTAKCPNNCGRLAREAKYEAEIAKELHRKGSVLREEMELRGKSILKEKLKRKAELEKEKVEIENLLTELGNMKNMSDRRKLLKRGKENKKAKKEKTITKEYFPQNDLEAKKSPKHDQLDNAGRFASHNTTVDYNSSNNDKTFHNYKDEFPDENKSPEENNNEELEKPELLNQGRTHYFSALRQKQTINQELVEVKRFLSINYGLEKEFATLNGQCFRYSDLQYVYELCPFANITQISKSGSEEILLGSWADWAEEDLSVMTYDNGAQCANGIKRTAKVTLKCALINDIENVKEPNKCEYLFTYRTPAACKSEVKLQHVHTEL